MGKKLTVKETKLVKGVAQGKTRRQAAKDAGYSGTDETVSVVASQTLNKPNVKEQLHKELEKQGITVEAIVKPIADGLKAEKVSVVGNGDQAMAEITPDHNIRIKSSQIASKWMGIDQVNEGTTIQNFGQMIVDQKGKYDE